MIRRTVELDKAAVDEALEVAMDDEVDSQEREQRIQQDGFDPRRDRSERIESSKRQNTNQISTSLAASTIDCGGATIERMP